MPSEPRAPVERAPEVAAARLRQERIWAEQLAKKLPAEEYEVWAGLGSTHRFLAQVGKVVYVWQSFMDEPKLQQKWTLTGMSLDPDRGLQVDLVNREGSTFVVTHQPRMLDPGVFIWLPFYVDYQHVPGTSENKPYSVVSLVVRSLHNPSTRIEGTNFIGDRRALEQAFSGAA